jgi:nucleoside-diphosphate-sugar epimerase
MKVLLLGATGLLGHNVLDRLAAEGHEVTALVRRADGICMEGDWRLVVGSPFDYNTLRGAADGCEAVINCAGMTDMSMLRREDYNAVNRDLCELVVRLMEDSGIKVLVHTSTANTIGYGCSGHPADETAPMQPPFKGSYYADSKREGELVVLDAARNHSDWHVVVVNPGFMIGAWDVKPSSGRMLSAAYRRRLMVAPQGGKAFVAVQDVAQAMVNALSQGVNGARYLVVNSHACIGIKDLYELQARTMGYRQNVLTLPDWVLSVAGLAGDILRSMGIRTELSTRNVRQLMVREYYDNGSAVNALSLKETPIEQAIVEYHKWNTNKTKKL